MARATKQQRQNRDAQEGSVGLMIVPQAALFSRLKGTKDLHYYRQLDKNKAGRLYSAFIDELKSEIQVRG